MYCHYISTKPFVEQNTVINSVASDFSQPTVAPTTSTPTTDTPVATEGETKKGRLKATVEVF